MLPYLRLAPVTLRTLQSTAAVAANAQAVRPYTLSLIAPLDDLQGAGGCSTSDCSCRHGSSCRCSWQSPLRPTARGVWEGLGASTLMPPALNDPVGALHGALARLHAAVRTTFSSAAALQVGWGQWAGGSGGGGGGLLLARRLPAEPEPFEDEYNDDDYEDGEYVDLDDEDLMGDLGEVEEAEEDWRRYLDLDEEDKDDGVGEDEDNDDDLPPPPLPPSGPGKPRTV